MERKTSTIPKAAAARILIKAGAKRVSASAAEALSGIAADISLDIARKAVELAKHSGRKTVHESDVKFAARKD